MLEEDRLLLPFTAHNVRLPSGEKTIEGRELLSEEPYLEAVLRTLELTCPMGPGRRPRVADLGCLEGGFAVGFARAGYDVVGIEARTVNYARCMLLARAFDLPNLRFALDDVRNVAAYGEFDAVFCAGLLYHLDQPAEFLRLLGKLTTRVLLLQTHYAPQEVWDDETYPLSDLCWHEGRLGRWFKEWDPDWPPDEIETNLWASVGNSKSFWLTKKHLLAAIQDAGFPLVFEQYDFLGDIVGNDYIERHSRGLFVGIKSVS